MVILLYLHFSKEGAKLTLYLKLKVMLIRVFQFQFLS